MSAAPIDYTRTENPEQAVLGSVMLQPAVLGTLAPMLEPGDFARPAYGQIFSAMQALDARGSAVDPVTLGEELERRGELAAVGGMAFLGVLLDVVPSAANVVYYAELVRNAAQRRALSKTFDDAAALARAGDLAPTTIAAGVRTALQHFERANETGPRRFALFDDVQIAEVQRPAWIIDGVLPGHALAVLIAEPKMFKSFLALDWACHVALGLDWHGRQCRQGSTVYVYAEGATSIRRRVAAWKRYARIEERLGVFFLPRRLSINTGRDVAELLAEIERTVQPAPVLIILDTVARNMDGNENATEDMSAFVRGCDQLRDGTGATVLAVHHKGTGGEDRGRGSTALEAAADTVILCSRDEERLMVECKWMKDAPEFAPLALEAVEVAPSLVLKPSGVTGGVLKGQRLQCLVALHQNFTAESGASYKAWHESTILGASSFNKAREWLRANSYVSADGGKWKLTDAGRLALPSSNSTRSIVTPLHGNGARSTNSTLRGGSLKTPRSGVDPDLGSRVDLALPFSGDVFSALRSSPKPIAEALDGREEACL